MADASSTTAQSAQPAWDATQYEEALAHLERLQEQIDVMRRAIPSIVEPMVKPAKSKTHLFVQLKTAAVQAVDEVQALRLKWTSEQIQDIMKHSQESFDKNRDLSKAATIPRYGWIKDSEVH
ncbi:hypothetical protein Slin15195_G085920 [Septoria linicola]|uniref:Uncharacterized protein n=1 Tax=Septoria linicola TaxID=215465 RepID=A0A9Q9B0B0_9PEZI|nr:hypothetical protein Slin14017_G088510 [Septoria linicola]USW55273.1 hypothetical protein Slin15195_G085920 [Septoria linicola]